MANRQGLRPLPIGGSMKAKSGPDVSKMVKSNHDTVKGKGNPIKKDQTRKEGKKPKMG